MEKSKYPRWKPEQSDKPWRKKTIQPEPKKDWEKEFLNVFKSISYNRSPYTVWNDFVTMTACSFSNALTKVYHQEREELYLSTARKYSDKQVVDMARLLCFVTHALDENPEQDFLGKMFMQLGLGNENNGQFFTPYSVSRVIAELTLNEIPEDVKQKGYSSICDPCCGSGTMLIAAANNAKNLLSKNGYNFQNHVLFVGQDIDQTVALMAYIQLSLLGVAGYIKVGNTLTEPMGTNDTFENYWFTPMYYSEIWETRRLIQRLHELREE